MNKVNNPNQSANAQTGPPTSQSANPTQGNQNSAGQWSQGKSNNAVGPGGPNPSGQNNNGNNVAQQPSGSNANNNQVNNPAQGTVATTGTAVATNPSTKAQLEQLNTMREALFSQDGWGCVSVVMFETLLFHNSFHFPFFRRVRDKNKTYRGSCIFTLRSSSCFTPQALFRSNIFIYFI